MRILLFANTDWYLYNFRLALAKAIRELGVDVVLVSPPGEYGLHLEQAGFRWIPLRMDRRSLNPWAEVKVISALASIYRRERPDLVHHFTIKSVIYGTIAALFAGIPNRVNAVAGLGHVFTSDSMRARVLRPILRALFRSVLRTSQGRIILQNFDDRDLFLKNRIVTSDSIRVIRGSGVNTDRFCTQRLEDRQGKGPRVLMATRLLWEKGVGEYAEAARLLKTSLPDVEFLLAGAPDDGNPSSVPIGTIASWQKEGILTALGHVDDMAALLQDVDIAVLPSYYGEGTPRTLLEAAACGLPIVATNVPGCREIVEHKVNGLLIPAKDPRALAEALEYLASHPKERRRMGEAGRRKVMEEFDERIVIRRTMDVYRELLAVSKGVTVVRAAAFFDVGSGKG
jgi:glycosyltransferase involved in cell wall biosynthesis